MNEPQDQRNPTRFQLGAALILVTLRTRRLRRHVMFWQALTLMGMIAVGLWLVGGFLESHPTWFLIYWLLCFGFVILLLLLASYDLLMTPREIRAETAAEEAEQTTRTGL